MKSDLPTTWYGTAPRVVWQVLSADHYHLQVPEKHVGLSMERLFRDKQELKGELAVYCEIPGVPAYGGIVSISTFNASSERARSLMASAIHRRVQEPIPWGALLDEFCIRVLAETRKGTPAVPLMGPLDDADDRPEAQAVTGATLPVRLPSILFGDGGSCKSYLALEWAAECTAAGMSVLYVDWELNRGVHKRRMERLRGAGSGDRVQYMHCTRSLVDEIDNIAREIRRHGIDFAICDSIGFACNGAPEDAVVANAYFRAVGQLGCGSLHLAHVSKSEREKANPHAPFGSIFWHNQARATWHLAAEDTIDDVIPITLSNRKNNLGPRQAPMPMSVDFTGGQTRIAVSPGDW
jgi:hypothetical protein